MGFMKAEELQAYADKYNLNIDGLSYQEKNKYVQDHMKMMSGSGYEEKNFSENKLTEEQEEKRKRDIEYGRQVYNDIKDKRIIIAPAIRPEEANVLFKYDEELDYEKEVEEVSFDLHSLGSPNGGVSRDGTYRILGETGKKVIAQSTIPKENAGIEYHPGEDWFPLIVDPTTGAKGYQFKKYVKPYLEKAGIYEEYAHYFDSKKYPNNNFYICGHSCVRKELVDWIFKDVNSRMNNA